MNKKYVSLNVNSFLRQILVIGYTKDGGFFIKDLVRINAQNRKCKIVTLPTNTKHTGTSTFMPKYKGFTSGEAKLTHHFDGNAQISGTGVLSGYKNDGTPKGASIKSFPLKENNDGGPVFTFLIWGSKECCREGTIVDTILVPDRKRIHPNNLGKELNAYVVKGFYILKECISPNNPIPNKVIYHSPIEGDIELTIIQSPDSTPGVIGLMATYAHHGFTDKYGFTFMGAPGKIYDENFCDSLAIVYPFTGTDDLYMKLDYCS